MKKYLLITAAGEGKRFSEKVPKQFYIVNKKEVLIHTILKFFETSLFDEIIVIINEKKVYFFSNILKKNNLNIVKLVLGGSTNQISIYKGLKYIVDNFDVDDETIVTIHDGVRPLVDKKTIISNLKLCIQKGNAVTAKKFNETPFLGNKSTHQITNMLQRENLYIARAPQNFKLLELLTCHNKELNRNISDNIDSANIYHKYNSKLYFNEDYSNNIKLTTKDDLALLEYILS